MDLSYGPAYETFRSEVRNFIETHRDHVPRGDGLRSERLRSWQKLLIENGYTARTIPTQYGRHGAAPDMLKARIIADEFAAAQMPGGLGSRRGGYLRYQNLHNRARRHGLHRHRWPTLLVQAHRLQSAGSGRTGIRSRGSCRSTRSDMTVEIVVTNPQI